MSDFITLPIELLYGLISDLPESEILRLCTTNRQIAGICSDSYLWRLKLQKDYPDIPISSEPRAQYLELGVHSDYTKRRYRNFNPANIDQWRAIELSNPNISPVEVFHLPTGTYQYAPSIGIYVEQYRYPSDYLYVERKVGDPPLIKLRNTGGTHLTREQATDRVRQLLHEGYIVTPRLDRHVPHGSDPIVGLNIPAEMVTVWARLGDIRITEVRRGAD